MDAPSRAACRVLGGSHLSMASERESTQWEDVLRNRSDVTVVLQLRSNLVKWAWSFYRTGAMRRLRRGGKELVAVADAGPRIRSNASRAATKDAVEASALAPLRRERIHLRAGENAANVTRLGPVVVDATALLRMVVAKQARSERLLATARRFAQVTTARRERLILYEAMQSDMTGEMRRLYAAMGVPFSAEAHAAVGDGELLKHAPEDLSRAIANWDEVQQVFSPHPCLMQMLLDTRRRPFDECGSDISNRGGGGGGDVRIPCGGCSWRTPILDSNGELLDDAVLRDRQAESAPIPAPSSVSTALRRIGGALKGDM